MNADYFDKITGRRGTNSYKWDSSPDADILPMWVADMDFRTAPPVIEALTKRAMHGIFGYTKVPAAYYHAVTGWFERRHNWHIEPGWILYTTGVVPALSAIIMALAGKGDHVIVQEPVYNCFFSSIRNNGCRAVSNDLIYRNGMYSINYDDLEQKAAHPKAKLLLLCNPHNPAGRAWTPWELARIGEICLKHDVIIVSDEIHCDLVYNGHRHTPFASISPDFAVRSVTCTAPSKTFNLAGLQAANIIAADVQTREKINKALNINEVCEINPFAVDALIAAYNEGDEWLDSLKEYLYGNYIMLRDFLSSRQPQIKTVPLEATYLAWLDCTALDIPSSELASFICDKEKLWLNEGTLYGQNGEGFLRLNFACPRRTLARGLEKLNNALACRQTEK